MKATIEKVTLKIGNKAIELTLDEARELWQELNQMFNSTPIVPYPVYPTWPPWYGYPPVITYDTNTTGTPIPAPDVRITC